MVNPKELWIGDTLQIVSSGKIGRFEGMHKSGKLRIRWRNKILLATYKNVQLVEEKQPDLKLEFKEDIQIKRNLSDSIDLHIESLNPSLINGLPERILDFQYKSLLNFLDQAKEHNRKEITIIHGKGTGVLRDMVLKILKADKSVLSYTLINNEGATKVLFF